MLKDRHKALSTLATIVAARRL